MKPKYERSIKETHNLKKLLIACCLILLLSACKAPDYGSENTDDFVYEKADGTEVVTLNGIVVEVTDDNIIRIKVPKRGDLIEKGLHVNEEGIIDVALASISIPVNDLPFADETNQILKDMLLSKEIKVELPTLENSGDTANSIKQLFGYISFTENDVTYQVQDILLKEGLALLDQSTPYVSTQLEKLKEITNEILSNTQ